MSSRAGWEGLGAAIRGEQCRATIVLLASPLLMVTWWYYGNARYLAQAIPDAWLWRGDREATAGLGSFLAGFVLLGVIPALLVRLAFRERLADYGVRLGDRVRTLRATLVLGPCFVLGGYLASLDPAVQALYPLNKGAARSPEMFAIHAACYFLFYVGWEFHFRGFLQFGLRARLGDVNALLVQVLASALLHFGRSAGETYASILVGLLWGVLAFRTRSLLAGLLQHFLLGITLDWFLCYGR